MRNRVSILCLSMGVLLLVAKLAAVLVDPASASTGLFPQLIVAFVIFALLRVGWRARIIFGKKPRLRWLPLILVTAGWVMTSFILLIAWVDQNLAGRTYAGVYEDPHKVWATRGLVTDGSDGSPIRVRNSIESISYAFNRGAKGTEVDVFYDPEMGVFVVSHSRRYEKPNGILLTLDSLFDAVGGDGYFWLDWKKLRHLNVGQLKNALARLQQITDRGDLRDRVYVEGETPLSLLAIKQAGFQTIYDCKPTFDSNIMGSVVVDLFKAVYYFGGFTVMGLNSGIRAEPIYGPNTRCGLRNIPVFLYHLPDDVAFIEELVSSKDVRVIIIRQDVNRFSFVAGNSKR
jgi:hypothetical protein